MNNQEELNQSLKYVGDVLELKHRQPIEKTPWLAVVWAGYCLVGFTLLDFVPEIGRQFMAFGFLGGVVFTLVYAVLLNRRRQQVGESPSRQDKVFGVIVAGTGVALVALVTLAMAGRINGELFSQVLFIILGMELFLFGAYGQFKPLVLSGLALTGWAVAITWFDTLQLTIGGGIIAAGIFLLAMAQRRAFLKANPA